MSYHGTVYCGYCGKRGHNKAGCQERKKAARENPDSHLARRLEREQEIRKQAVESRRCSYCNGDERGGHLKHNRRGCKMRKSDVVETKARAAAWREKFVAKMKEVGLGIGSLVYVPSKPDHDPKYGVVYYITNILWDSLTHRIAGSSNGAIDSDQEWSLQHSERHPIQVRVASHNIPEEYNSGYYATDWTNIGSKSSVAIRPMYFEDLMPAPNESEKKRKISVVGRISEATIERQLPEGFLSGENICPGIYSRLNLDNEGWRVVRYGESKRDENGNEIKGEYY